MGKWISFEIMGWSDGDPSICKNIVGGNTLPDAIYGTT